MMNTGISQARKVLIVSSHPLFGQGLRRLLQERPQADVQVVSIVPSVEEAVAALTTVDPDLVIVDYDDERVNRDEFLARFVEGEKRLRVVLLSLKEGGSEAIVYDRRTLAASQIDDWLKEWTFSQSVRKSRRRLFNKTRTADRKADLRRANMKHGIFATLLVVALAILVSLGLDSARLLPVAASVQAGPIDDLFRFHFRAIAILFALIVGLMVYSIFIFRRRKGDETDAPHIEGNPRLEVLWTIVPLGAVLYISALGAVTLGEIQRPDPRPLEVNVYGTQWSWRFEYPELGVSSTELVLPVNKQVLLRLSSTDVIHSFWVPEFRVKQDALPGGEDMIRDLRVTPNLEGDYKVRCAEMCGVQHAYMEADVSVLSQSGYDAWVAEQTASLSDDPVARGQRWSQQFGCLACHTIDGATGLGPTWQGLYGHEVEMEDGTIIVVDEAYLLESITDPGAKIVKGFNNIMPANIADPMTEDQILDVIEFIKSLQ